MLVVTRKKEESLFIGEGDDRVEVSVLRVEGGRVRLGVVAGPGTVIVRDDASEATKAAAQARFGPGIGPKPAIAATGEG